MSEQIELHRNEWHLFHSFLGIEKEKRRGLNVTEKDSLDVSISPIYGQHEFFNRHRAAKKHPTLRCLRDFFSVEHLSSLKCFSSLRCLWVEFLLSHKILLNGWRSLLEIRWYLITANAQNNNMLRMRIQI